MGGDSLAGLPRGWFQPQEFAAACDFIGVMRRPQEEFDLEDLEKSLPGIKEKLQFIDAPLLEIASNEIRQRAAEGQPYRYYLPELVYQVIRQRNLYRIS
jgi:nicotinate-nucleotide adenylyltransferase